VTIFAPQVILCSNDGMHGVRVYQTQISKRTLLRALPTHAKAKRRQIYFAENDEKEAKVSFGFLPQKSKGVGIVYGTLLYSQTP